MRILLPFALTLLAACQATTYESAWEKATLHISDPGVKFMNQYANQPIETRPTVIYMHGCTGIGFEDSAWMEYLHDLGYSVIAPDSYERPGGRVGCGGTIPERVTLRHEDLRYSIEMIGDLPWVDTNRLYMMGFSEGGHALTTLTDVPDGVRGIVLIGVDCQASGGTPLAPSHIPVLNIVGSQDEYDFGRGCTLKRTAPGTRVMIVRGGHHVGLAVMPATRQALKEFLVIAGR